MNNINKFLLAGGIFLLIAGIFSYDLTDTSFEYNRKELLEISIGIVLIFVFILRNRSIKKQQK